ncbi:MAG: hypothetical protein JWM68_1387 [Verrucomicrobiales bacterium]|nr:hypothetical protein [Verrucomicrobiales bacterium]
MRTSLCKTHAAVFLALMGLIGWLGGDAASADDLTQLLADRTAIERVYYNHRTGTKLPFEQTLPLEQLRRLMDREVMRENALKNYFHVDITTAQVESEVTRINQSTRAPEILAEIKVALGSDAKRFARSFVRPIVVDRELRERFENDNALHAHVRTDADKVRAELLHLRAGAQGLPAQLKSLEKVSRESLEEHTWEFAQATPARHEAPPTKVTAFSDLPRQLQTVLKTQLRNPGDVSAVIEMPSNFLVYLSKERTDTTLTVAAVNLPKLDYDIWLSQQPFSSTKP